eukprot:COSAG06_NODE_6453_length_2925_cov_5.556617_4_plen_40_part_00
MAHNDLKIENILVFQKRFSLQLKLADFENGSEIGTVGAN